MGICSRKKKKVITNKFEEANTLRKDIRESASHLMNKKSKSRWISYQQLMETHSRKPRRLYLPNKTCVGGTHRMYLCLLISRWNLRIYYNESASVPSISNQEFIEMAELEAIIWPVGYPNWFRQTSLVQSPTCISTSSRLGPATLSRRITMLQVDELSDFAEQAQHRWDGSGKMATRHLWDAPTNDKKGLDTVWLVKRKVDDLDPVAKKLISWFIKEFTNYCLKMTKQKMLAMACNPLSATIVMLELELLVTALNRNGGEIWEPFLLDFC